jgi:putative endonuclease
MATSRPAWIHILGSRKNGTLYIGVTTDLRTRIEQHKRGSIVGFTKQYGVTTLVHFEEFVDVQRTIAREKVLKGWIRARKVALIEATNPDWDDLAAAWAGEGLGPSRGSG